MKTVAPDVHAELSQLDAIPEQGEVTLEMQSPAGPEDLRRSGYPSCSSWGPMACGRTAPFLFAEAGSRPCRPVCRRRLATRRCGRKGISALQERPRKRGPSGYDLAPRAALGARGHAARRSCLPERPAGREVVQEGRYAVQGTRTQGRRLFRRERRRGLGPNATPLEQDG